MGVFAFPNLSYMMDEGGAHELSMGMPSFSLFFLSSFSFFSTSFNCARSSSISLRTNSGIGPDSLTMSSERTSSSNSSSVYEKYGLRGRPTSRAGSAPASIWQSLVSAMEARFRNPLATAEKHWRWGASDDGERNPKEPPQWAEEADLFVPHVVQASTQMVDGVLILNRAAKVVEGPIVVDSGSSPIVTCLTHC
ncbi:hypothetical protein CPB85DRAFT_1453968 [Mucidula mucida]|nr:hypothetical protein CPB85DRAFT_1453968 [Mucidula mucida]